MKVVRKQRNSRMCIICGLDNEYGVQAPFYVMEDGSVMTRFAFRERHQSYPGRVHGGMIAAMLDELGLRSLWIETDDIFGVTTGMTTRFKQPVPYGVSLKGKGQIIKNSPLFVESRAEIYDEENRFLASAEIRYLKMPVERIQEGISYHEEMCYLVEDGVKEID